MNIQNVLVPVDFSPASQRAVDFSVTFAKSIGAQLTLLHVNETDNSDTQDAKDRLQQLSKTMSASGSTDLDVQTRIRTGNVEDEICAAIDDESAGVVVMGTHPQGLLRKLIGGSVAQDILRKLPVPLLTISSKAQPRSLTRILLATDLADFYQEGFRFAMDLARTLSARLIVQYSIEPIPVSYGGNIPGIDDPTDRKQLMEAAREKLSDLEAEGAREHVLVVSEVTEGAPAEKIIAAAEDSACGLIVLTIHEKGALERALLGSTAERVVREARVPVLSFPVNGAPNHLEAKVHSEASQTLRPEAAE
jgi:nucleotide-binding universal stress UspA family protein